MSAKAAATLATFCDFRTVKGRKTCQLIMEVPIEHANAALQALGGIPDAANPVWVGIARVVAKPADETSAARVETPKTEKPPRKHERQSWNDLSLAQQAGIRCGEKAFRSFLVSHLGGMDGENTPQLVRRYCGVESRKDILKGSNAEQRWNLLESSYRAWLAEAEFVPVRQNAETVA